MLRFAERQAVDPVEHLDEVARAQIIACGQLYDGQPLPAEARLSDDDDDEDADDETSWRGYCQYAPVLDGDRHVYDAWFIMTDSGTIFRARTTECVATIIQFGLECDDPALRDELGKAMIAARLLPPGDASYAHFKALHDADVAATKG